MGAGEASQAAAVSPKAQLSSPTSVADLLSQASRSSSEHFYDALEEVPKGVRAAVQIFEVWRTRFRHPLRLCGNSNTETTRRCTSIV